jgi:predicted metal-binding membrane protein
MIWRMFTPRAKTDPLDGRFDHLDRSGRMIAGLARRPVWPVLLMVVLTGAIAWWFLLSMAGAVSEFQGTARPLGPGMSLISPFLPFDAGSFAATIADLCLSAIPGAAGRWFRGLCTALALYVMWLAMAAAMMLPTAAPMIRTYAEIADTAAARGEPVVHPLVLTAGYLFVWALAAIGFRGGSVAVGAS